MGYTPFCSETTRAKERSEIFEALREKTANLEFCPCEIILQKWRRNKDLDKHKLREFVAGGPALQEMLKQAL